MADADIVIKDPLPVEMIDTADGKRIRIALPSGGAMLFDQEAATWLVEDLRRLQRDF